MIKKIVYSTIFCSCMVYGESLKELIDLSLQNKLVTAQKKQIESLQKDYDGYKNANLPNLSLGGQYSMTDRETASVPDKSSMAYLAASYTIYDGSKRTNIYDQYRYSITGAKHSLEQLKNDISLSVIGYYYNYLSLQSSKKAKIKQIETLNAQKERLLHFVAVGNATSDELDQIISSIASAKVSLHELELQSQTILHNLHYITGQEITIDSLNTIKSIENLKPKKISRIEALKDEAQAYLSQSLSKKRANYPKISIEDTYSFYDMDYEKSAYAANAIDEQNIISLKLTWNLFDFGANSDKYDASYKTYLAKKDRLEYEINKANVDLKLAIKSYEIAQLKIDASRVNLKAATSAYEKIEDKYQNGVVDYVTYLDALSNKFDAQSGYEKSKHDLEIQKANMIYYSGKNLQEYIK